MDMMKDMYNEGDENMKKVIGEAMMKAQRGEKTPPPSSSSSSSFGKGIKGGLDDMDDMDMM